VSYFLPIPAGEPLVIGWGTVALIVTVLGVAAWRHRDLLPLACLVPAGWLLTRQSSFSRIEIQDGHWGYISAMWLAAMMMILVGREVIAWVERRGWNRMVWVRKVGWGLLAVFALSGLGIRHAEGLANEESVEAASIYQRWREQRAANPRSRWESKAVVAGEMWYVEAAISQEGARPLSNMVFMFASIDNRDWARRVALEGWLQGMSTDEFRTWQD